MKKYFICCTLVFSMFASLLVTGNLHVKADSVMTPAGDADYKVIDISHYNTVQDWSAVKAGVNAVYIKATEGSTYTDPTAAASAQSAQGVGLDFGFYAVFSDSDPNNVPTNVTYAAAQADHFYNFISQYSYTCVPVLDLEGGYSLSQSQVVADVQAFADEFKKLSGQDIMIYANQSTVNTYLDSSLSGYKFWYANYNATPGVTNVWSQYTIWQTGTKTISGVAGSVDYDLATDGIFLPTGTAPDASLTADSHYTVINGVKSFNVTASLTGGSVLVVSTLADGSQQIGTYPVPADQSSFSVAVDSNALKSSVYLIMGTFEFDGTSIPKTYALTQFVTAA